MKLTRAALICLGLVPLGIGLYGLWNYYPTEMLVSIGKWLAIGIVLHDGVLVPLTLVTGALIWRATRGLPAAVGRIIVGGMAVAGVLILLAAPAIKREGVPANPTVLTQHYGYNLAWVLVAIGVTSAILAALAWLRGRRVATRRDAQNSSNVARQQLEG